MFGQINSQVTFSADRKLVNRQVFVLQPVTQFKGVGFVFHDQKLFANQPPRIRVAADE
jgi:hypothetical protein